MKGTKYEKSIALGDERLENLGDGTTCLRIS